VLRVAGLFCSNQHTNWSICNNFKLCERHLSSDRLQSASQSIRSRAHILLRQIIPTHSQHFVASYLKSLHIINNLFCASSPPSSSE
jgi:hypothetical protein